jgi:hypothetical protein
LDYTYDLDAKELFLLMPREHKLHFLANVFAVDFREDAEIKILSSETVVDGKKRFADIVVSVDGEIYHIEIEATLSDGTIAFRMWSYSARVVMQHGNERTNVFKLPEQKVIYLRKGKAESIHITLILPNNCGKTEYTIPCVYLPDITAEVAVRDFTPLAPARLVQYIGKPVDEQTILKETHEVTMFATKLAENGELNEAELNFIRSSVCQYSVLAVRSSEIIKNKEEAIKMVEQEVYLNPIQREELRWAIKKETDMLTRMKEAGVPLDMVKAFLKPEEYETARSVGYDV